MKVQQRSKKNKIYNARSEMRIKNEAIKELVNLENVDTTIIREGLEM
jgi:hypothetical protein